MRSERIDESLLVPYLLGRLSGEEEVQVEDRAFADPEYLGALQSAEADLIDAYVRGELSPAERRSFEGRFLTSPQRRGKVEFARSLARVMAETTPVRPASEPVSAWQSLLAWLRSSNPRLRWAGALVTMILIAGVSWLVYQNGALRSQVAMLEAQHGAADAREKSLRQELAQSEGRAESLAAQVQGQPSPERPHVPLVASLVLLPGLSRAETRIPELTLPAGAQIAHIEIQLDARDKFPRFHADLHSRGGRGVLLVDGLRSHGIPAGQSLSIDVPVSALDRGEYELALKGLSDRVAQDIGYYYFRVRKQ